MKMISWNVNGVRAALKKGFDTFIGEHAPDVLCLQEVKAERDQVDYAFDGYEVFWHHAERKKGYSGTAVLTKKKPISVFNGLHSNLCFHDDEGRVQTVEFDHFYLVNVYTPNAGRDLSRLEYRVATWDKMFLQHLKQLEKKKPVIFCGDLNVAHKEIDLANPKTNKKNAGFTIEERESFENYIAGGFVDTFRFFHPDKAGEYSWWSYRAGARERNIGWRLDYFLVSNSVLPRLSNASILQQVQGSDHCPVVLQLEN